MQRCKLDIERKKWAKQWTVSKTMDVDMGKAGGTSNLLDVKDSLAMTVQEPVAPQLFIQCNFCKQSIQHSPYALYSSSGINHRLRSTQQGKYAAIKYASID